MIRLFQNAKRLISVSLVTLLMIASSLTLFPTPAKAQEDIMTIQKLEITPAPLDVNCSGSYKPNCGNTTNVNVALATGTALGAVAGSAATLSVVSTAGSVAGLSAAGITSGLSAIGATVGGGMGAGVVLTSAAPVVAAGAIGYGVYWLWDKLSH
jgi:hypothetical protein